MRLIGANLPREGDQNISPSSEGQYTSITLTGPELITLTDSQWSQLCHYDVIVFSRTTPEQKLRIVKELQSRDSIVGMAGDGVNDAPSLRAADIGIALGSSSDIAIEASDMVLLDSFSAIVEAVQYGGLPYNLQSYLEFCADSLQVESSTITSRKRLPISFLQDHFPNFGR